MKKTNLFFASFLFLSILAISFVSAQSSTEQVLNSIADVLAPIFKYTLGDVSGANSSQYLFVKVMVFFVMMAVFYIAASRVPGISEHPVVVFIITVVLGILGTRFLSSSALIEFVWLPTGVGGIVLTSLLPFILVFFFLEAFESPIIRKVGWVLFGVVFFGMAMVRWNSLNDSIAGFNLGWLYVVTGVLSLILIFADRKIRLLMFRSSMHGIQDKAKKVQAAEVMVRIDELYEKLAKAGNNAEIRKALESQIKDEEAKLKKILK